MGILGIVYRSTVEKKIKRLMIATLMLVVIISHSFTAPQSIVLGEEDSWIDLAPGKTNNIVFIEGKLGYLDLRLKDGEYEPDANTDLLLHFNHDSPVISGGGYYTVVSSEVEPTSLFKRMGGSSGAFRKTDDTIVLNPEPGSLFYSGHSWGDFTLEFWLYPATLDEGQILFHWTGSRSHNGLIYPQRIQCAIQNNRIAWKFKNFFVPPDFSATEVVLQGNRGLIPRTWHHHLLRFRSATGLVEYLLDGKPAGIVHATGTSREGGPLYVPYAGRAGTSALRLGGDFVGFIDELRISKTFVDEPFVERYRQVTGVAVTRVFDLGYSNSRVTDISASDSLPGKTDIYYFYRIGDKIVSRTDLAAEWIPFFPGDLFPGDMRGRYIQLMVELLPDGTGALSPTVHNLQIQYEPDLPPHPPGWLAANAKNGGVELQWQESHDADIAGYVVYYGEKPGQYFGTDSSLGRSPIDAGDVTRFEVAGLSNGKLYYFAVSAYDKSEPPHLSDFSSEVTARPGMVQSGSR